MGKLRRDAFGGTRIDAVHHSNISPESWVKKLWFSKPDKDHICWKLVQFHPLNECFFM